VHNTVRHQDVGNRHTGVVHKDASFLANGDGEVVAAQCGKRSAVLEARRVANRAFDNVVAQNIGKVLVRDVSKSRANVAERLVGWSKDGDVGRSVNRLDEVGLVEGTTQRAETGSGQSVRGNLGENEESVNDMNDTTGEVDILHWVSHELSFLVSRYIQPGRRMSWRAVR
jgi:hypothetical protein